MECNTIPINTPNKPSKGKVRRQGDRTNAKKSKFKRLQAKVQLAKDYPWHVITYLLDDVKQFLPQDDYELVKQIVRDRDFYSYCLLEEGWGLQSINTQHNVSLEEIKAKYCICSLLKKFQFPTNRIARIDSAKQKFYNAEDLCKTFNHGGYMKLLWPETEALASVVTYAKAFLSKLLGDKSPSRSVVVDGSRHGPGSNLDTCNGQISLYDKYRNWPYSCTKKTLPYARFLIETDKRWLGALEDSYRDRNNIAKHAILNRESFWDNVLKVVDGNRITFVPKNAHTERTIAIEPAMNLMLQLGVDRFIRQRLKRYDIDLDSQVKNQIFAGQGSKFGNYATLDLSMASDSLSLKLCEILLPPEWYDYLLKLRSPSGLLGDEVISYEKISSMGNGYTFALESAIFAAICFAVIKLDKDVVDFKTDFCVFGDDIIIRSCYSEVLCNVLPLFGLKLNNDKSFLFGKVRESCGSDWYEGKPIRPVFFTKTPSDVSSLFTDINRLKRLLSIHFGVENSRSEQKLINKLPSLYQGAYGPYSDQDFDSYIHSTIKGRYKVGCWEHVRYVKIPKTEKNAKDFFFRKLMHNLNGPPPLNLFSKMAVGGSRFDVLVQRAFTLRKMYSRTENWCDVYAFNEPLKELVNQL